MQYYLVKINSPMQSTSVIDRLLDILLLFQDGRESWSVDDMARMLDLPKSTCYRLVRALQEKGFLEKSGPSNYQLGISFMRLSGVALSSNRDIRLMALPSMKRIADVVKESVSLMRLMNRQVVCVESIEGQHTLRVSIPQGYIQPLHAGASSRVLLAALPEDSWHKLLDFPLQYYTDTTITDFDALCANLQQVRRDGYAVSNGEVSAGARAVAVPLLRNRTEVIAALSIEAPATRMTDAVLATCLEQLRQEAAYIHQNHH